jgi:hypothetical protein
VCLFNTWVRTSSSARVQHARASRAAARSARLDHTMAARRRDVRTGFGVELARELVASSTPEPERQALAKDDTQSWPGHSRRRLRRRRRPWSRCVVGADFLPANFRRSQISTCKICKRGIERHLRFYFTGTDACVVSKARAHAAPWCAGSGSEGWLVTVANPRSREQRRERTACQTSTSNVCPLLLCVVVTTLMSRCRLATPARRGGHREPFWMTPLHFQRL